MSPFNRERIACAYFFAVPGLMYGIFTARLPALKQMINADDSQIGFLLLVFGAASFIGLISSRKLVSIFGIKKIMGINGIAVPLFMCIAGLAFSYIQLIIFALLAGVCGGLLEVAMNAQGMQIENRYNKLCMASLHACFSLGGMCGSLFGSMFAYFHLSPFINFLVISIAYLALFYLPYRNLVEARQESSQKRQERVRHSIPRFIIFCGLLSMLCYVSEGSVGEWGSILLHSVKGAPQDQAALVFGCFCLSMVIFRFLGDRLRQSFGDVRIILFGGLTGALGMGIVLLANSVPVCLCAYFLMGMGFAPIVPVLFSRAGKYPGVSPARASSTMSIMSYTGLLVFPPVLGMLGDAIGLGNALWIIFISCLIIAFCGAPLLSGKRARKTTP